MGNFNKTSLVVKIYSSSGDLNWRPSLNTNWLRAGWPSFDFRMGHSFFFSLRRKIQIDSGTHTASFQFCVGDKATGS